MNFYVLFHSNVTENDNANVLHIKPSTARGASEQARNIGQYCAAAFLASMKPQVVCDSELMATRHEAKEMYHNKTGD